MMSERMFAWLAYVLVGGLAAAAVAGQTKAPAQLRPMLEHKSDQVRREAKRALKLIEGAAD